jgi:hypothetical protein
MTVKPREIRQARSFFYRRGVVVASRYCGAFVVSAKVMGLSFAQLDEWLKAALALEAARAFTSGIVAR